MPVNFIAMGRSNVIFLASLLLAAMLFLSFHLRQQDFNNTPGAPNLEATYHVLLTVTALRESSIENHWLLPTVSLGKESDKRIPWGRTIPTATGDQIYTSFTPAGFLAPYAWFGIFNQAPTATHLAQFNFILGAITTIFLFFFLVDLLRFIGYNSRSSVLSALGAVSISIFSREALLSHGIIYWSQSLYQVFLVTTTWCLFKFLSKRERERTNFLILLISSLAFVSAMTEWTAFVFNVGMALVLLGCKKNSPKARSLAIYVLFSTFLAGILTVLHYGLALGFEAAIRATMAGFFSRNTSTGNWQELLQGYVLSYGFFILIIYALLIVQIITPPATSWHPVQRRVLLLVFAASCIPLLENIFMLQYASQFSFDRLKFILPSSIIIALALSHIKYIARIIFIALLLGACFQGYADYKSDLIKFAAWQDIDANNKKIRDSVLTEANADCAVFSTNIAVRGYTNLLFHRGVYEHQPIQSGADLIKLRHACASIFLEGFEAFPDMPQYISATITNSGDASNSVKIPSVAVLKTTVDIQSFYLTDDNWERGISRFFSGFFVPNLSSYSSMYVAGKIVQFKNGDTRTILRTEPIGQYLHIYVSGPLLNFAQVGIPSEFVVLDKKKSVTQKAKNN